MVLQHMTSFFNVILYTCSTVYMHRKCKCHVDFIGTVKCIIHYTILPLYLRNNIGHGVIYNYIA